MLNELVDVVHAWPKKTVLSMYDDPLRYGQDASSSRSNTSKERMTEGNCLLRGSL